MSAEKLSGSTRKGGMGEDGDGGGGGGGIADDTSEVGGG